LAQQACKLAGREHESKLKKFSLLTALQAIFPLLLFSLPGCLTNNFGRSYRSYAEQNYPATNKVEIYQYTEKAMGDLWGKGFILLGISRLNGPLESKSTLINQGKKVGADIVLVNSGKSNTAQGNLTFPQYQPGKTSTATTPYPKSGNVNGAREDYTNRNDLEFSNSIVIVPTYTPYNPFPFLVDSYGQFAVFLRRKTEERKIAGPENSRWVRKSYQSDLQGDWIGAIIAASVAIRNNPGEVNAYVNRALAYSEKGLYEKALDDSTAALSLDPQNTTALNNRGLTYQKMGQKDKAIQEYRLACENGLKVSCQNFKSLVGCLPSEEKAYYQAQGIDAFSAGNFEKVISATDKVIEIDPKNAEAYSTRCGAKANLGRLEEAKKDCRKSIEYAPNFSMAYNNLGYVLELEGAKQEAATNYEISCNMGNKLGCQNKQRLTASPEDNAN